MNELADIYDSAGLTFKRISYRNTYQRPSRNFGALCDRATIKRLTKAFRSCGHDLIHLNLQNVEDGADLIRAASRSGVPCVATVHVTRSMHELNAAGGRLRDWIARYGLRQAQVPLIGVSSASARALAQFVNGGEDLLSVSCHGEITLSEDQVSSKSVAVYSVPNGVARPRCQDRERLRHEWNVGPGEVVLGTVARLEEQKNPLFLCDLLKHLPAHVRAIWIGDGRLRSAMEQRISECGLRGRIHLDGWQQNAAARMAGFDVFVLPSLYEGLPLAILEAMSLGLPCVVSDVDGARDAVSDGNTGHLCCANDVQSWKSVLIPLIESEARRQFLGAAAAGQYQAEFSLQAMARRTAAVYRDVIVRQGE